MSFELTGKNILITGGTSGIGLAVAKRFIKAGANVVISGRRSSGQSIAKEIGAIFVQADLADFSDITVLFDKAETHLGYLDGVVNNAGRTKNAALIAEQSLAEFDSVFDLNLRAAYEVLRLAAQRVRPGGSIISTASISAMGGAVGRSAYHTSKAALVSLTKTVALELAPQNIRVNAVSPGLIQTEIWEGRDPDSLARQIVPMKRLGTADEAAAIYQFLASDESSYVTGANYFVDGGFCASG